MADAFNDVPLDLSAASAAALADLQAEAPATPATPEASEPAAQASEQAEPEVEASPTAEAQAETPTLQEETPEEAQPTPEEVKKWTLRAAGKTLELTEDELVRRAQMGIDYEQKTQRLAAQEKVVQTQLSEVQRQQTDLLKIVRDPQKLEVLRQQVQRQMGLPDDPNEVVTAAQAAHIVQAQLEQAVAELQARQEAQNFTQQVAALESDYKSQVSRHVTALAARFPLLAEAHDDLQAVLLTDVSTQIDRDNPPDDVHTVLDLLTKSAEKKEAKIRTVVDTHKKMAAVRQAKLERPAARPEPPGGQGIRPAPATSSPKLGSRELTAIVTAELQEAFSKASR